MVAVGVFYFGCCHAALTSLGTHYVAGEAWNGQRKSFVLAI
jgi:hypothetical protein